MDVIVKNSTKPIYVIASNGTKPIDVIILNSTKPIDVINKNSTKPINVIQKKKDRTHGCNHKNQYETTNVIVQNSTNSKLFESHGCDRRKQWKPIDVILQESTELFETHRCVLSSLATYLSRLTVHGVPTDGTTVLARA